MRAMRSSLRASTRRTPRRSAACLPVRPCSADCRSDSPVPTSDRRWLILDREVVLDLRSAGRASHIVIAQFCDAWRDPVEGRPEDLPIGWVTPAGQPLARYELELASGGVVGHVIRRRFEVNDGIVGWGQGAFAAVPHLVDTPLDWRGPYPAAEPGGYAAPGHAGLLGILPGSWGPAQTGVADSVPSPTGDIALWLYTITVPDGPADLARLRLEPLAPLDAGGGIVIAAVTAFDGRHRRWRSNRDAPCASMARRAPPSPSISDRYSARGPPRRRSPRRRGDAADRRVGDAACRGRAVDRARRRPRGRTRRLDRGGRGPTYRRPPCRPRAVGDSSSAPSPSRPPDAHAPDRRGGGRRGQRCADARPRPVPGRGWPLPPAARSSRRDQRRAQRGQRRRPAVGR